MVWLFSHCSFKMQLSALLQKACGLTLNAQAEITGIAANSKSVCAGDLFVSVPCAAMQAHVKEATERGACAIVYEEGAGPAHAAITVPNARQALAQLCGVFFPDRPKHLIAVTGTNGKSSVVSLFSQLLSSLGKPSACVGTLGVQISGNQISDISTPSMTTYNPLDLHRVLGELAARGCAYAAIEATSHGLSQYRLDGLCFEAAALTNITQDHLDYHGSMVNYATAKARLFSELIQPGGIALLNRNTNLFEPIATAAAAGKLEIRTFACSGNADLLAQIEELHPNYSVFSLSFQNRTYRHISLPLAGSFQIANALCALGLVLAVVPGCTVADLIPAIAKLQPIPGRMQVAGRYNGGQIFVDFCHTPDALERVLRDLRQLCRGNLTVVFGCGGNRDADKRSKMGRIASACADRIIVTDDNPRDEAPEAIRAAILAAATGAQEVPSRTDAITQGIAELGKHDILLVAGRGHERFQIRARGEKVPCNDLQIVQDAIRNLSAKQN